MSRIGGIGLEDIQQDVEMLHSQAFDPLDLHTDNTLESKGLHKMRGGKEEHLYNPQTIHMLQQSTWTGSYEKGDRASRSVSGRVLIVIRKMSIAGHRCWKQ